MSTRIFGNVPGIPEGSEFENRFYLSKYGVHRPIRAGVSGSQTEGADSIIVAGRYEDDDDLGDSLTYAGNGGRHNRTGVQVADQQLSGPNLALLLSYERGLPVRVIRGANGKAEFSPAQGYRYDGLFRIESYWQAKGRSGFQVWYFRLVKLGTSGLGGDPDNPAIFLPDSPQLLHQYIIDPDVALMGPAGDMGG